MIELNAEKIKPSSEVSIPGSKSYTNRALLLASLANGKSIIRNPLFSDDTEAMLSCLNTLGIKTEQNEDSITISGGIKNVEEKEYELFARHSGTTIRFILSLAAITKGTKKLYGESRLNERPIKDLVNGLRQIGAKIEHEKTDGLPPLLIKNAKLIKNGKIKMSGATSSQFLSSIMMVSPIVGGAEICVEGEQISKPYIDMTIDTMQKFGASVQNENYKKYVVQAKEYTATNYRVEGDFSSASYFFAVAALAKTSIKCANLNPESKQADIKFLRILEKLGLVDTETGTNYIVVKGKNDRMKDEKIDMEDCPDQVQTFAVVSAFAPHKTIITGIQSLRLKETDRVSAIINELAKMGIRTEATEKTLTIWGGNPKPAIINTYNDHRMAMSFSIACTRLNGMKINNPEVVNKTFPGFWNALERLGIGINTS